MFTQRTYLVWLGILCLAGMFLLGQEAWVIPTPQVCADLDGDGYGRPASTACAYPEMDCDNNNPNVNPGMTEDLNSPGTCGDSLDNDCNGLIDLADPPCNPCIDNDSDGYGYPANPNCPYPEEDCDDNNPAMSPGLIEGPDTNPNCGDNFDNDCDGLIDLADPACISCSDNDNDGYGFPASENCPNWTEDCDDSNHDVNPGATEGPDALTCNDVDGSLMPIDNDCDGNANLADTDCTCYDNDLDGYGNPASLSGIYPELDCDDSNNSVNPGAIEGPLGNPTCSDLNGVIPIDNDCDGTANENEFECQPCPDSDGDGYGVSGHINCTYPYILDCDDTDPNVNPGIDESDYTSGLCRDGIDNDCDGDIDLAEGDCDFIPYMVPIPATSGFLMGDSSDTCMYAADECPVHPVSLSAFQIDAFEVTNRQYKECVTAGACTPPYFLNTHYNDPAYDIHPVVYVTWQNANAYCTWAGKRLPTEAEWEYAARGGLTGNRFPLGDAITITDANYGDTLLDPIPGAVGDTTMVGSYPPNGYGLYDMAGNVEEIVKDFADPFLVNLNFYEACCCCADPLDPLCDTTTCDTGSCLTANNPEDTRDVGYHSARGGHFASSEQNVRVGMRSAIGHTDVGNHNLGFRCAQ